MATDLWDHVLHPDESIDFKLSRYKTAYILCKLNFLYGSRVGRSQILNSTFYFQIYKLFLKFDSKQLLLDYKSQIYNFYIIIYNLMVALNDYIYRPHVECNPLISY